MDRKKLFLVTLGHLSCDINGGALPAALPFLRAAHHLDYQATGGLMLAYSCLASLIQPAFGVWSDRHNKPWFIPVGVILGGLGLALLGFVHNYWLMCLSVAVCGVGSAFFHPEGARFANKVSGSAKGSGLSFFSIGGNLGFIFGPLIVGLFLGTFGLGGLAIFFVIALVTASLLLFQISRISGLAAGPKSPGEAGEDRPNNWPQFLRLLVIVVSRAMVFVGCNTFIPLYWVNVFGQSRSSAAVALVIFSAFGVAFNLAGGWLADRLGYVSVIRTAFFLMIPATLSFAFAESLALAYCLLPALGLVLYLSFSAQVALGQRLLSRNVGLASGVTLGVASTLGGVAQPCLGWIADGWGLRAIFLCLAGVACLGALFSLFLAKERAPDGKAAGRA